MFHWRCLWVVGSGPSQVEGQSDGDELCNHAQLCVFSQFYLYLIWQIIPSFQLRLQVIGGCWGTVKYISGCEVGV